jgi:hypothetical protein
VSTITDPLDLVLTVNNLPENSLALEVATEIGRARSMFPAIHNPHEGLAVIREEYLEFEAEVWKYNPFKNRDTRPQMRTELIQLAAMALRTILDTIDKDPA